MARSLPSPRMRPRREKPSRDTRKRGWAEGGPEGQAGGESEDESHGIQGIRESPKSLKCSCEIKPGFPSLSFLTGVLCPEPGGVCSSLVSWRERTYVQVGVRKHPGMCVCSGPKSPLSSANRADVH